MKLKVVKVEWVSGKKPYKIEQTEVSVKSDIAPLLALHFTSCVVDGTVRNKLGFVVRSDVKDYSDFDCEELVSLVLSFFVEDRPFVDITHIRDFMLELMQKIEHNNETIYYREYGDKTKAYIALTAGYADD